ncbi:plasma kallikrein-like isoform 2-T2 [Lycodopsis pacificus]
METLWILGLLLSICSLSFSQECNQQLLENVDFPGADIKFVFSPDANHCQQLCTQHPSCRYFTFSRADWIKDNSYFRCYLKTSPSGQPTVKTQLQGVTSGFSLKPCSSESKPCLPQLYHNVDFYGADYQSLFTADYDECQRACTRDPACQFFTFINGAFTTESIRYKCHLKFSWSVPVTSILVRTTGLVSGFSHNTEITQEVKPACEGKLFPSTDIPGNDVVVLPAVSPEHCQTLCSAHPVCTYFSFVSNNFNCYLKNNKNEMVPKAKEGVTSGLPARFCQLDTSWLKATYEGVDFRNDDIRNELKDDADTCQKTCNDDPTCQFYTYVKANIFDREDWRRCYLKRAITIPAPPKVTKLANAVSGFQLRNCGHVYT